MTATCETCRHWSTLVARQEHGGPLQAICGAHGGIFSGEWVTAKQSCDAHQAGEAVDRREVAA